MHVGAQIAPLSTSKGSGDGPPHQFYYPDSDANVGVIAYGTPAGANGQIARLVAGESAKAIAAKGSFTIVLTGGRRAGSLASWPCKRTGGWRCQALPAHRSTACHGLHAMNRAAEAPRAWTRRANIVARRPGRILISPLLVRRRLAAQVAERAGGLQGRGLVPVAYLLWRRGVPARTLLPVSAHMLRFSACSLCCSSTCMWKCWRWLGHCCGCTPHWMSRQETHTTVAAAAVVVHSSIDESCSGNCCTPRRTAS